MKKITGIAIFLLLTSVGFLKAESNLTQNAESLKPEVSALKSLSISAPRASVVPSGSILKAPTILQKSEEIAQAFASSKSSFVNKLPHKAEDTSSSSVSYNVENGKLVLYTYQKENRYERRELDTDLKIRTNSDVQDLQILDSQTIRFKTEGKKYELKISQQNQVPLAAPAKSVTYEFELNIEQGFKIKAFSDQSYEVKVGDETYTSNQEGAISLPDLFQMKLNFINDIPSSVTAFLSDRKYVNISWTLIQGKTEISRFEVGQQADDNSQRLVIFLDSQGPTSFTLDAMLGLT